MGSGKGGRLELISINNYEVIQLRSAKVLSPPISYSSFLFSLSGDRYRRLANGQGGG